MDEIKKIAQKIKKKQKLPVFRGRFGKRKLRRRSKEKWNKWRRPRGTDILLRKDDGSIPKIGYSRPSEIRGFHPSGMEIIYIGTPKELENIGKEKIVVIKGKVGGKKRIEIVKKAEELGIKVSNKGKQKEEKKIKEKPKIEEKIKKETVKKEEKPKKVKKNASK